MLIESWCNTRRSKKNFISKRFPFALNRQAQTLFKPTKNGLRDLQFQRKFQGWRRLKVVSGFAWKLFSLWSAAGLLKIATNSWEKICERNWEGYLNLRPWRIWWFHGATPKQTLHHKMVIFALNLHPWELAEPHDALKSMRPKSR